MWTLFPLRVDKVITLEVFNSLLHYVRGNMNILFPKVIRKTVVSLENRGKSNC